MQAKYEQFKLGVRAFVDEVVLPLATTMDQQQRIPEDILRALSAQGYMGAGIKKRYGGSDISAHEMCALHEEVARGHGSVENLLTVTGMFCSPVQRFGSAAQKERWLCAIARGECIGAIALTEPGVGSDLQNITTQVTVCDDALILNGEKKWITLGQIADVFLVLAKQGDDTVAVLIERDTPGLEIESVNDMLGLRANMLGTLTFNDCRIPLSNKLGQGNQGIAMAISFGLDEGRFTTACGSLGLAQGALEVALEHVKSRQQFNRSLIEHQLVQRMICNMVVDVKTARLMCLNAAKHRDELDPDMVRETLTAKYHAANVAKQVTDQAVQLLGAAGCHQSAGVERYYRDAKIMEIIEGTTQIHQIQIAKAFST